MKIILDFEWLYNDWVATTYGKMNEQYYKKYKNKVVVFYMLSALYSYHINNKKEYH